MSTIVTRAGKGSPLTNTEVDSNFTNLNTDKAELSGAVFTGAITTNSTIDGRDVATDGTKLDGIEASATADQTGAQIKTAYEAETNAFTDAQFTKLGGIEASADVTDTANVTAAGALMDCELTSIASVKALNQGVASGDSPTFAALTSTGEIVANGGIALGDSDKATFGASDDLQIYHDGSHSYVGDYGTGNLSVTGNNLYLQNTAGETYFSGISDGAVSLYHNNLAKLATTSTGIDVTGLVAADSLTVDNFTLDGTTLALSSGDFTLDVAGDIILDADGDDIQLKAGSFHFASITKPANNGVEFRAIDSDRDMFFKGNDGGSEITALTLDMSAAGAATFNSTVTANSFLQTNSANYQHKFFLANGTTGVGYIYSTGSTFQIDTQASQPMELLTNGTTKFKIAVDGSLSTPTAGTSNVRFGVNAGNSIASGGNYNVVVGDEAGTNLTTGDANVAVGYQSLFFNTTGAENTALGVFALYRQTTPSGNVGLGYNAGGEITTGANNVAVGHRALDANTTASNNTAVGYSSLGANTTGTENVAVGQVALASNTTGNYNTALGRASLNANTTASNNTAVGYRALDVNTTGDRNTAVGSGAADSLTTGAANTALGYKAMDAHTTGNSNTAVGAYALDANTTAGDNTAVGASALTANTTGASNSAFGVGTLQSNTTAANNTAVGTSALGANTEGDLNTAVGAVALENNTTGANNSAFGRYALNANTTGYENTALGEAAGYTTTTGYQNIMIGRASSSTSATASGQCTLGGGGITDLRCNDTTISSLSDQRDKTNIIDSPYGLDFINTVRPVQFKWETRDGNAKDGSTRIGFLAQELLAATSGNNAVLDLVLDDNPERLEAKYGNLLPIAIQAIQELSGQVDALTARITTLEG